jgi:hypothetical protein
MEAILDMNYDTASTCASLNLTACLDDLSAKTGNSQLELLRSFIDSGTYDILYDPETRLWMEGPDYLAWFNQQICLGRDTSQ